MATLFQPDFNPEFPPRVGTLTLFEMLALEIQHAVLFTMILFSFQSSDFERMSGCLLSRAIFRRLYPTWLTATVSLDPMKRKVDPEEGLAAEVNARD